MPQNQQEHTGGRAAAVNAHVPDAGAAAGDEGLDGLVDAGSGHAQGERRKPLFPQHPEQPPKQQSQRAEFGKMGALSQQNSPAEGFPLTELSLYTTDMLMNMDWDLLGVVNPILDGATGIRLQDGASCDILLPFDLYRYRFTSAEWNRLEQSNIWLQVTNYPTRKIVRVNIGEE